MYESFRANVNLLGRGRLGALLPLQQITAVAAAGGVSCKSVQSRCLASSFSCQPLWNFSRRSMLVTPLVLFKTLSQQTIHQWGRNLLRGAANSVPRPNQSQHMTTSQKPRSQLAAAHQYPTPTAHKNPMSKPSKPCKAVPAAMAASGPGAVEPSQTSSNGSEHFALLDRPASPGCSPAATASTKSAKRKAAEALLAAQYGGISTSTLHGTATAAAPGGMQFSWQFSSDAAPQQAAAPSNKRTKSMLSAAITRLGGPPAAAGAAQGPAAATATAGNAVPQHQRQNPPAQIPQVLQQQREAAGSSWQQPPSTVGVLEEAEGHLHVHSDDSTAGGDQQARMLLSVEAAGAAKQQQRPVQALEPGAPVVVPACGAECTHVLSQGWCHSQVKLPHVDWGRVLEVDLQHAPSFKMATGYERLHMPGGIQVLLVEQVAHIPAALAQLRSSMQDPVVAIDLEWRPEFGRGFTPVAMVQLSSSKLAVLIRTCRMGYRLPQPLKDFLADPQVHLLGFSWAGGDEGKMRSTFGVGAKDFGRFMDLQQVAQGLGYNGFGLARLTRQVLGIAMPKNKKISMSNWECSMLSRAQVKYAALDVLMAGQVFRALRLWHSSPSLCEVCHYNLGAASMQQNFSCSECDKNFWDIKGYVHHCQRAGHKAEWAECDGCGCARALPWPSMQQDAGAVFADGQQDGEQQQPSSQQSS